MKQEKEQKEKKLSEEKIKEIAKMISVRFGNALKRLAES